MVIKCHLLSISLWEFLWHILYYHRKIRTQTSVYLFSTFTFFNYPKQSFFGKNGVFSVIFSTVVSHKRANMVYMLNLTSAGHKKREINSFTTFVWLFKKILSMVTSLRKNTNYFFLIFLSPLLTVIKVGYCTCWIFNLSKTNTKCKRTDKSMFIFKFLCPWKFAQKRKTGICYIYIRWWGSLLNARLVGWIISV